MQILYHNNIHAQTARHFHFVDGTIVSTHHSDKSLLTKTSEANEDPALNF